MERQENWKPIEDFEDYMISDKGRVWSHRSHKILSPAKDTHGYLHVNFYKNKKQFKKYIHKLIAEKFISNPEGLPEVHHKNEIKTDNRLENLQWVSHQFNIEFSKSKSYVLYDKNENRIEIFNIKKFANDNNLNVGNLVAVANGTINSHKGFTREPGTKLYRKEKIQLMSQEGKIMTFQNQQEAAECIGVNKSHISRLLKGKVQSCKGWRLHPFEGIFGFINENQKIS